MRAVGFLLVVGCNSPADAPRAAPTPARDAPSLALLDRVVDLAVGYDRACALRDRHVYCWTATDSPRVASEPAVLPPIKAIAAGGRRACAISEAGELFCWGEVVGESATPGVRGQVYAPNAAEVQIRWGPPQRLDFGRPISRVAVGMTHICALTDSHDLWCFGSSNGGQLAIDTPRERAELKYEGVDDVEVGHGWTCKTSAGKRFCWGQYPRLQDLAQAEYAQTAGWHLAACGVTARRGVMCEGTMSLVYPGKKIPTEPRGELVAIDGVSDVRQLAMGGQHACALRGDGTVWCWKDLAPAQAKLPGAATKIGAGWHHSCALLDGGTVSCDRADGAFEPIRFAAGAGSTPASIAVATAQLHYALRAKPTPTELSTTTWRVCLTQVGQGQPTFDCSDPYTLRFDKRAFAADTTTTHWTGTWQRTRDTIRVSEKPAPAGTRWAWDLELHGEQMMGTRHIQGDANPSYWARGRQVH